MHAGSPCDWYLSIFLHASRPIHHPAPSDANMRKVPPRNIANLTHGFLFEWSLHRVLRADSALVAYSGVKLHSAEFFYRDPLYRYRTNIGKNSYIYEIYDNTWVPYYGELWRAGRSAPSAIA